MSAAGPEPVTRVRAAPMRTADVKQRARLVAAGVVGLLAVPAVVACSSGAATSGTAVGGPPTTSGSGRATASGGPRWRPAPGTTWQWQLTGTVDTSVDADVYDLDLFTTSAATVDTLHRAGRKVVCYVSVGSSEDFRPDHGRFPAEVIGKGNGWEGERWLDVRRLEVLTPIMATRFDLCRAKGFDGVEPDNVDGYANDTGFGVTAAQQLAFNGGSPTSRTRAGSPSASRTTSTRSPRSSPTSTSP